VAQLPAGTNLSIATVDELYELVGVENIRQWPARYPNGNPAKPRDGYTTEGTGIAQKGTPTFTALPTNVNVCCDGDDAVEPAAEKDGTLCSNGNRLVGGGSMEPFGTTFNFTVSCSSIPPVMINGYGPLKSPNTWVGDGLNRFTPARSYWETSVPAGVHGVSRAAQWNLTDPVQWKVHAYHPIEWGNWGFEVSSYTQDEDGGGSIMFARGGNQEARGGGSGIGAQYYSGILEELDDGNEFYYDRKNNALYWSPPPPPPPPSSSRSSTPRTALPLTTAPSRARAASPPAPSTALVVPQLARLIEIVGSSNVNPVTNVKIVGFTLQHTAPTFCCEYPYESVSGGDWSIHRGGMIFVENATDSEVSECVLDSPGGNGIFLSGYSQRILITKNEVKNSGDSSIAAVGYTALMDGRDATYPYNNTFSYNHLHDWGVWGKQTSAIFFGMTREQIFDHNIIHTGPRAGINQNDGFAGGNTFSYNLVFNTVLDTGDHGNFNSWDRKPWLWSEDPHNPKSQVHMVPQQHHIKHNFIIRTSFLGPSNNLYSIDHDDGSSMYNDTFNFLVYGGIKFRDGLSKHASGNFMAFPNGPDTREVPFAAQCQGNNNSYVDNTVVSGTGQFYGSCAKYKDSDPTDHVTIDFNSYFSPGANFSDGGCGASKGALGWKAWQSNGLGQDQHSTLADSNSLTFDTMIAAGRVLVFPSG